ncbi:MAG: hypothetical protein DRI24_23885, partial [Deltaproteobacteria bacterium]
MGCFSFLCKKCNKPINSNSFSGEPVHLFLLSEGEVIDKMEGQYDSYGRVFKPGLPQVEDPNIKHHLGQHEDWFINWRDACNLLFNNTNIDGIAAIHDKCYNGKFPTTISEDDPDQGWGEYEDVDRDVVCT